MSGIVTVAERKARRVASLRAAVARLRAALEGHAVATGAIYTLYGSAARDDLRHDSDVDILVEAPDASRHEALSRVEESCARLGLVGDIAEAGWFGPRFHARIAPEAIVIGPTTFLDERAT
jgi:predicted nucleotidyltransferase